MLVILSFGIDVRRMDSNIKADELFEEASDSGDYYFLRDLVQARKQAGRKATRVLFDIARLSVKNRRIVDPEFYFKYRLFDVAGKDDEAMYAFRDAKEYLKLNRDINFDILKETAVDNKVHMETISRSFGIPFVQTQAIVSSINNAPGLCYTDAESAAEFFRTSAQYPLFGKPNWSSRSSGVVSIDSYIASDDSLLMSGAGKVALDDFVGQVFKKFGEYGFLLQSRLKPHESLIPVTGNAIGCIRLVTLMENGSVKPMYSVWKIPAAGSIADNFWRSGNRVAAIDHADGSILRVQIGSGVKRNVVSLQFSEHVNESEFKIPNWNDVLRVCENGAALFSNTPVIGWDIAITDDGPVIVEANTNPDHGLFQLAFGYGIAGSESGKEIIRVADTRNKLMKEKMKIMKKKGRAAIRERRSKAIKQGLVAKEPGRSVP